MRAVPFGTLIALFMLWFGISVPLVFVGSYFGYKKPAPDDPVRTNKIPRQIPEQARSLPCARCSYVQGPSAAGGMSSFKPTAARAGQHVDQRERGFSTCFGGRCLTCTRLRLCQVVCWQEDTALAWV